MYEDYKDYGLRAYEIRHVEACEGMDYGRRQLCARELRAQNWEFFFGQLLTAQMNGFFVFEWAWMWVYGSVVFVCECMATLHYSCNVKAGKTNW